MKHYLNWNARFVNGNEKSEYFPAQVPGNVQYDYAKHIGILDTIQYSDNVSALEQTEDYTWEYTAAVDTKIEKGERAFFVAEGIDYIFDILVGDTLAFSGEGMYTPTKIDITDKIANNTSLTVVVHPHPKMKGAPVGTRDEAADSVKPPVCYGWDWNPRLLISGFWLPAYIETKGPASINNCEASYKLDLAKKEADVHFEIVSDGEATITIFSPKGEKIYCGTDTDIKVENVELWWCNGQGKANLYTYTVKTEDDEVSGTIGFRTISLEPNGGTEWEPEDFPKDQYPMPITVTLNGRRIFAKGSNYVNPEIFNANTTAEENEELVRLAKEANMNIFRIWGGAGLAKPEFYDYCDKYGILVWQEFPLACNNYKSGEKYLATLEKEAVSIIKSLRSHPSLAIWCGGNELFNGWSGMTDQSLPLRLLNKLCYEYDKNTPFLATSPRCGMGHGGYTFLYDDGKEVYEIFQTAHHTAYSEFGVPSVTSLEELKKIIPEDELFPIEKTPSWIKHHAFEAWGEDRWLCTEALNKYFGKAKNIEEVIDNSTWLQCEGYKAAFEEGRRQWPHCSVTINWCYNEPWTVAAGNSLIGYPNIKKPAYYAVKKSLSPTLATAKITKFSWCEGERCSFEVWYHNDTVENVNDKVRVFAQIGDNEYELLTWDTGEVSALSNKIGPSVNFVLPRVENADFIKIILKTDNKESENEYKLQYKCLEYYTGPRKLND